MATGSRFCNLCGATVGAVGVAERGMQTQVSASHRPVDVPERAIFVVRPSFLFVGIQYGIAAALWLFSAALVAAITGAVGVDFTWGAAVVLLIGLALFMIPGLSHLRRQRYLYTLTNYKLEIQTGLLSTTTRNIPLTKIQDVTVSLSILKRMLGLGDVAVDVAAAETGRLYLRNIPKPKHHADLLLRELQRWN